jgi:hypothetical protein
MGAAATAWCSSSTLGRKCRAGRHGRKKRGAATRGRRGRPQGTKEQGVERHGGSLEDGGRWPPAGSGAGMRMEEGAERCGEERAQLPARIGAWGGDVHGCFCHCAGKPGRRGRAYGGPALALACCNIPGSRVEGARRCFGTLGKKGCCREGAGGREEERWRLGKSEGWEWKFAK